MTSALQIDRQIADLARNHAGLVPHGVLLQAGVEKAVIQRRLQNGLLFPVLRGVSTSETGEVSSAKRAIAAGLIVPNSVVSHRAAAALRGAPIPEELVRAELTVPNGTRTRLASVQCHESSRPFLIGHTSWLHGVRVTSANRNVLEVAQVVGADMTELILDHYLHTRQLNLVRLQQLVGVWGRGTGTPVVSQLVSDRLNGSGIVRSWLEQQCAQVIQRAGLPKGIRNFEVYVGRRKRVLDIAWPEVCVGVTFSLYRSPAFDTRRCDRTIRHFGWENPP